MKIRGTFMNRILVLGCSGSGKSTLSTLLARHYQIPPIYMDVHYWNPDWTKTNDSDWKQIVTNLCQGPKWVMDGTFPETLPMRLRLCDGVIFLNLPMHLCMYRAIKRALTHKPESDRPDLPPGCEESIDLPLYRSIWNFKSNVSPKILTMLTNINKKKIIVYTKSEQSKLISSVQNGHILWQN